MRPLTLAVAVMIGLNVASIRLVQTPSAVAFAVGELVAQLTVEADAVFVFAAVEATFSGAVAVAVVSAVDDQIVFASDDQIVVSAAGSFSVAPAAASLSRQLCQPTDPFGCHHLLAFSSSGSAFYLPSLNLNRLLMLMKLQLSAAFVPHFETSWDLAARVLEVCQS